jgi:hypothetical protein
MCGDIRVRFVVEPGGLAAELTIRFTPRLVESCYGQEPKIQPER